MAEATVYGTLVVPKQGPPAVDDPELRRLREWATDEQVNQWTIDRVFVDMADCHVDESDIGTHRIILFHGHAHDGLDALEFDWAEELGWEYRATEMADGDRYEATVVFAEWDDYPRRFCTVDGEPVVTVEDLRSYPQWTARGLRRAIERDYSTRLLNGGV